LEKVRRTRTGRDCPHRSGAHDSAGSSASARSHAGKPGANRSTCAAATGSTGLAAIRHGSASRGSQPADDHRRAARSAPSPRPARGHDSGTPAHFRIAPRAFAGRGKPEQLPAVQLTGPPGSRRAELAILLLGRRSAARRVTGLDAVSRQQRIAAQLRAPATRDSPVHHNRARRAPQF